jgi:hypothetical protein
MARKPFKGSAIDNVLEHGTGALNIDASRVKVADDELKSFQKEWDRESRGKMEYLKLDGKDPDYVAGSVRDYVPEGRFPSNVIMDEEAGAILDKQAPKTGNASSSKRTKTGMTGTGASLQWHKSAGESNGISDGLSGASKFFYCPKVSRAERHAGFENLPKRLCGPGGDGWVQAQEHQGNNKKDNLDHIPKYDRRTEGLESAGFQGLQKLDGKKGNLDHIPAPFGDVKGCYVDGKRFAAKHQELQTNKRPRGEAFGDGNLLKDATQSVGNNHPTVKPVELMKYLVRLVTPKGGRVLDPFNGSGSTGMACVELGYEYTGIDLDKDYVEIANKRISAWEKKFDTPANNLFEEN